MKQPFIIILVLVIFSIFSCKNRQQDQQEAGSSPLEIEKAQLQEKGFKIGSPVKVAMEKRIHFSGKIVPMINAAAKICAPVEGIVKAIYFQPDQEIKAKEVLLEIGGNSLLDLQLEFASSSIKFKQLKINFERVKKLYEENINTENEYLSAESDYKLEHAIYSALKIKLQKLNLDLTAIENGNFVDTYKIYSPIDGQLGQINILPGQFVNKEDEIAEVYNKNKTELQLFFFENDIPKIARGQKVVFGSMDEAGYHATAWINRVGNRLNPGSNTVECYATIDNPDKKQLTINQLVNGEVIVSSDSVLAVPQTALISGENRNFLIAITGETNDKYQVEQLAVQVGRLNKNYVEIVDLTDDKLILLSGAQNIVLE